MIVIVLTDTVNSFYEGRVLALGNEGKEINNKQAKLSFHFFVKCKKMK